MRYNASGCFDSSRCVTLRRGVLIRLDALRCVLMLASMRYVAYWRLDTSRYVTLRLRVLILLDALRYVLASRSASMRHVASW